MQVWLIEVLAEPLPLRQNSHHAAIGKQPRREAHMKVHRMAGAAAFWIAVSGAAYAQTGQAPVGHRQPTQPGVATQTGNFDQPDKQRTDAIDRLTRDDARVRRSIRSICSNCGR
jgi:hypothetical protein